MTVKVLRQVDVEDFNVPTSVSIEKDPNGFINLEDLSWEVLNNLCVNYRANIFRIAKMKDSKGGI